MLHFLRRSTPFIVLLAVGVTWSGCTKGITSVQPVSIPDTNLRAAIEDALHKPAGATITNADMATLTSLEPGWGDIRELTGLEFAVNLTYVRLDHNQISDLSPLAGLTKLQFLNIQKNRIVDLSPLAGLINLRELDLSENEISDLSPLAGLTNLRFLGISDSKVSDLSPLVELTNLEHLGIHGSQLSDLSPLAGPNKSSIPEVLTIARYQTCRPSRA